MKRMKAQKAPIFNSDGTVRETELKIMNFRPIGANKNGDQEVLNKQWEEVSCIKCTARFCFNDFLTYFFL